MKRITRVVVWAWMLFSILLILELISTLKETGLDAIMGDPLGILWAFIMCLFCAFMLFVFVGGIALLKFKPWGKRLIMVAIGVILPIAVLGIHDSPFYSVPVMLFCLFSIYCLVEDDPSKWKKETQEIETNHESC